MNVASVAKISVFPKSQSARTLDNTNFSTVLATHFGISSSVQAFNVTVVLKLYIKLKHMIQILNIDGKMAG